MIDKFVCSLDRQPPSLLAPLPSMFSSNLVVGQVVVFSSPFPLHELILVGHGTVDLQHLHHLCFEGLVLAVEMVHWRKVRPPARRSPDPPVQCRSVDWAEGFPKLSLVLEPVAVRGPRAVPDAGTLFPCIGVTLYCNGKGLLGDRMYKWAQKGMLRKDPIRIADFHYIDLLVVRSADFQGPWTYCLRARAGPEIF